MGGCKFCNQGKEVLYQETIHTKLSLNTSDGAQALITECICCPPYANCALKGVPARSAFIINNCIHCGRKLGEVSEMSSDDVQTINVAYLPGVGMHGHNKGGIITGILNVKPEGLDWRLCYQVTYPDGEVDYVPVDGYNILKEGSK